VRCQRSLLMRSPWRAVLYFQQCVTQRALTPVLYFHGAYNRRENKEGRGKKKETRPRGTGGGPGCRELYGDDRESATSKNRGGSSSSFCRRVGMATRAGARARALASERKIGFESARERKPRAETASDRANRAGRSKNRVLKCNRSRLEARSR